VKLGITVRVMGPESTAPLLVECARAAEAVGLDDVWVADHIAIPPDDAEGSGGRYLDPLTALAYLAGATTRIGLGTAVLIVPYRPPLPTAKVVATLQELSGGRLRLGVGVGWMEPEFRALGVERRRRGRITDDTLAFLERCFAGDVVESNGQRFLFLPRPARPPVLVGGAPPHALARAARFGDGWMPMMGDPDKLAPHTADLRARFAAAGKPRPEVAVLTGLALDEPSRAREQIERLAAAGATRVIHAHRYADAAEFARRAEALAKLAAAGAGGRR
jgi:probable F420-dependent oxidoreductase